MPRSPSPITSRGILLLALLASSGCGQRLPRFTLDECRRPQFADVAAFLACRAVETGGGVAPVVPDYVGSIDPHGDPLGFYDVFAINHDFELPVVSTTYDVYCLRRPDEPGACYAVSCVLVRSRRLEPVRWEAVPGFIGTDGYDLTIGRPADIDRLADWMGEERYWNAVLAWAEIDWSSTQLPDPRFAINASDSRAIIVGCGKILYLFKGLDAQGRTVAVMVNVF